jgi:hypothetical protein
MSPETNTSLKLKKAILKRDFFCRRNLTVNSPVSNHDNEHFVKSNFCRVFSERNGNLFLEKKMFINFHFNISVFFKSLSHNFSSR